MTNKINKAISLGKVKGAKALLAEYFNKQHKAQWNEDKQAEYETMYPTYREMTTEEKLANDTNGEEVIERNEDYIYPQVAIEYITSEEQEVTKERELEDGSKEEYTVAETVEVRTPAEYVTQSEWLAETVVVTEAVEGEYDTEGMEVVAPVAEVTEAVRPYVAEDAEVIEGLVSAYLTSRNVELRQYKPIGEQLDMQYWDKVNGTTTWEDHIAEVKAEYPKV
jgi:hypothetical protein